MDRRTILMAGGVVLGVGALLARSQFRCPCENVGAPSASAPDIGLPRALADEPKKDGGSDELSLAGDVRIDEFNPDVKDKVHGDGKPCRGGMIRLRFPTDPKSICPILENDQPTQTVYGYMHDSLLSRDTERFEFVPMLSRYWKTRDIVVLKDGKRLEGRVVSEDEAKVVFAEGAWQWTIARHEVDIDEKAGKVTWKEKFGKGSIEGAISYFPNGRYTVFVEEKPTKTVEIARGEIASLEEEEEGGKKTLVSGVIRGSVYEFKMRAGCRWHDGKPVTVDDVVFSYRTIMNKAVKAGPVQSYFADNMHPDPAKAVCKVADDVVRIELKKQYFGALDYAVGLIYVLASHRYGEEKFKGDPDGFAEHFNKHVEHRHPVGSGRYRFSKWEENKYVEIVRNEDYWASQPGQEVPWIDPLMPYLDKIQWITINNKEAGLKALTNGEIDADFEIEQTTWGDKATNSDEFTKRLVRAKYLAPMSTYIGWNQKNADGSKHRIFTDKRVRLAMTYLIDRQRILDNIHSGLGEMVTGPFYSHGPFCDRTIKPIEYNPEKGKALLDQAGWVDHDGDGIRDKDGVKLEFTYNVHNAREYHLKIAEIVKQDLEKTQIKVNIKSTDFNSFIEIVNSRKFDAIRFAWGEPLVCATDPFQEWHSSCWENKGSNHCGYSNPEADKLMVDGRRELDFKKRQRMFKKLHKIVAEDQPYTFLFNLHELYFYERKFRNVKLYVSGTTPYVFDEWFIPKELQKEYK
ncbi:hypothetical protein HY251_16505 [bacterium]|nr:hypothetical protein [bacterium]